MLKGVEWEGENRTARSKKLVLDTAERNARMVAGWQVCAIVPHAFGGRGLICTLGVISRMSPTQTSEEFLARATRLDSTHS